MINDFFLLFAEWRPHKCNNIRKPWMIELKTKTLFIMFRLTCAKLDHCSCSSSLSTTPKSFSTSVGAGKPIMGSSGGLCICRSSLLVCSHLFCRICKYFSVYSVWQCKKYQKYCNNLNVNPVWPFVLIFLQTNVTPGDHDLQHRKVLTWSSHCWPQGSWSRYKDMTFSWHWWLTKNIL